MINSFDYCNIKYRVTETENIHILKYIELILLSIFKLEDDTTIIDGCEKDNIFYIYVKTSSDIKEKLIGILSFLIEVDLRLFYTDKLCFSPTFDLYEKINI